MINFGNMLNMIMDSGAEEHRGLWFVWPLGKHDQNSIDVRGSSLFALKEQKFHVACDMDLC